MKIKKDMYTLQPHGEIIHRKFTVPRGPMLDKLAACLSELALFGYVTRAERKRISLRIALQRPTQRLEYVQSLDAMRDRRKGRA